MKIVLILFFSLSLMAESWSVVCTSSSIKLKADDLKSIYFKTMQQKNGVHLVPLNLVYSHKARKMFMQEVLHVSQYDWENYYDEMHFMGIRSPLILDSSKAVKKFLEKIDGAIGYLPSTEVDSTMYEITRFSL